MSDYIEIEKSRPHTSVIRMNRPERIIPDLTERLQSEAPGNLAGDDATAMLCRTTNTGVRWRDNLLAPFRLFGKASDNTNV